MKYVAGWTDTLCMTKVLTLSGMVLTVNTLHLFLR